MTASSTRLRGPRSATKDSELLELAGRLTVLDTYLGYVKLDVDAFKQIKANPNVEMVQVDKSLVDAVNKASTEWAQKQSASNEWFKKAYEDQAELPEDRKACERIPLRHRLSLVPVTRWRHASAIVLRRSLSMPLSRLHRQAVTLVRPRSRRCSCVPLVIAMVLRGHQPLRLLGAHRYGHSR